MLFRYLFHPGDETYEWFLMCDFDGVQTKIQNVFEMDSKEQSQKGRKMNSTFQQLVQHLNLCVNVL